VLETLGVEGVRGMVVASMECFLTLRAKVGTEVPFLQKLELSLCARCFQPGSFHCQVSFSHKLTVAGFNFNSITLIPWYLFS
jgi:hypothetical protein